MTSVFSISIPNFNYHFNVFQFLSLMFYIQPQGIGSGRSVQGSRGTPSTSGQDAVVSSGVDADNDEDDEEEEIGSVEEDDSEGGSINSEYLGSEDTDYMALMDMTQKTSRKQPRQDTTSKSPPKRPRKK